jgi:serine/threonine protein kinase/CheY-like chemotaxis protein
VTDQDVSAGTLIPCGASIGRYVVLGWIARGAMGDVYAAYDPNLDRKLAIKLMRVERGITIGGVDGKTRLLREAQAIAKLSHPNVVIVHDVGSHQDRVFIAMELIEGGTLSFWLHAQPRAWREILQVFVAAARGLQHAHDANLVHRDFKPDNVMVRADGEVRVMDFGLVRYTDALEITPMATISHLDSEGVASDAPLDATVDLLRPATGHSSGGGSAAHLSKLTQTGVMMGTPAYMAPEQFIGQAADARSDQFSFCVALYEALFGVRPFGGATIAALAGSVLTGQINPRPEGSQVPLPIWQALRRGLSVTPAERYPSMNELVAELVRPPEPRKIVTKGETLASASELATLLESLLQRPVQAKQQLVKTMPDKGVVAVYVGDDGVGAALVHFDLPAAASTAAALTLVPATMVQEASRAGKLPQILWDNLHEVANVLTRLARGMSASRLRLQGMFPLPGAVPAAIAAALKTPPSRMSFDVAVSAYAGGRITVIGLGSKAAAISPEQKKAMTRALIVDDSRAMRLIIGRALKRMGVTELLEAPNGEEALKCLRGGATVDAVFVDWNMPVMDGLTFIKAVRTDKSFDRLPIVMVTTEGEPEQMEAALGAGANEYLVKPINEELLRGKLEGLGLKLTS